MRIIPPFYLNAAPLPVGVVERTYDRHATFLVGFPMHERKLWMSASDVEVVGHVE